MKRSRWAAIMLAAATGTVAVTAPAASSAAAPPARGTSVTALPAGLTLVKVTHSLLGSHEWYVQTHLGLPVLGTYYVRHLDRSGRVTSVTDGRKAVPSTLAVAPRVSAAAGLAAKTISSSTTRLAVLGGTSARLVWQVRTTGDHGTTETIVDATSGATLSVRTLVKGVEGRGQVFDPNPVAALGNENIKDKHDSDQAVLAAAYRQVTLTDLDSSGYLHGSYAQIINKFTAYSPTHTFVFTRHDDRFEQVNAYYGITKAQRYIQSLGFDDINNEAQKVSTNTIPDDNSFYDPSNDTITFGRGGVDDAEDLEVVWHELGHAIQDAQVPGFGETEEAGAIGEGFGDYWAVAMSQANSTFDPACVMDWDATSYTSGPSHCLRRVDGTKTTADMDGEVHDDGEIWSRALWDINGSLGRVRANKVILESQFSYAPDTSFAAAARAVVATARALYGSSAAATCTRAFKDRAIL